MGVVLFGLIFGAVYLWGISIGALLEMRREQDADLAGRCPAWVPLAHTEGELYRCGAPVRGRHTYCPSHAQPARRDWPERHPDWTRVEATRQWADARTKVRIGLPIAGVVVAGAVAAAIAVW